MNEKTTTNVTEKDSFEENVYARFDAINARFDSLEARLAKLDAIYDADINRQRELLTKIQLLRNAENRIRS